MRIFYPLPGPIENAPLTACPPHLLDAAVIFAPAGEIVPAALKALDKGGVLVLGGIHMSDIPSLPYSLLYQERVIRSVTNNTRTDALGFLEEAIHTPIAARVQKFAFNDINRALMQLKQDAIQGAGVIAINEHSR